VLGYLQKKSHEESQLKRDELEFRKEELKMEKEKLELDKQKFQLESAERRQRMDLEANERSIIMRIVKDKLLN
jgi:hypothetical protein